MKMPESIVNKLHPARFSEMSPKMAAFVGFICDVAYTDPKITSVSVTSDGFLLCQRNHDVWHSSFEGSYLDLENNMLRLFDAALLTDDEQYTASSVMRGKITDWRIN